MKDVFQEKSFEFKKVNCISEKEKGILEIAKMIFRNAKLIFRSEVQLKLDRFVKQK